MKSFKRIFAVFVFFSLISFLFTTLIIIIINYFLVIVLLKHFYTLTFKKKKLWFTKNNHVCVEFIYCLIKSYLLLLINIFFKLLPWNATFFICNYVFLKFPHMWISYNFILIHITMFYIYYLAYFSKADW